MIPFIFDANATDFSGVGLGLLVDCVSCTVTEESGGEFELEMEYQRGGWLSEYLEPGYVIAAKVGFDSRPKQAFRIYKVSAGLDGIIDINAEHIVYELANFFCMRRLSIPKGSTFSNVLENFTSYCHVEPSDGFPFALDTDYTGSCWAEKIAITWSAEKLQTVKNLLYTAENKAVTDWDEDTVPPLLDILRVYDTTFVPDNYTLHINKKKTTPTHVFRYGVNIETYSKTSDTQDVTTGIIPYYPYQDAYGNDMFVLATDVVVYPDGLEEKQPRRLELVDVSDYFDTDSTPTEAQVQAAAESYLTDANITGKPEHTIDIDYVDGSGLERICINDCVRVVPIMDESYTETVVKIKFDVLAEHIDSVEIGAPSEDI